MSDLTNALLEKWSKIPTNTLVGSLSNRIEAVMCVCEGRRVNTLGNVAHLILANLCVKYSFVLTNLFIDEANWGFNAHFHLYYSWLSV